MVAQAPATNAKCAAMLRALARAKAERLVAYPNADGSWSVKTYIITVIGPRANEVSCTCTAGARGLVCKHAICVVFCRKYGLRPIRPVDAYAARTAQLAAAGLDPLYDAFN